MSGTVSPIDPTAGDPTAGDLPPDEPPIIEIVDSPPDSPPFGDTTTPDTTTPGTADADFVVDARTLAADIAAHAPAPTLIADISSLFAHMLAAFTGALADIVSAGAGTPATGGTTPPDTVPPIVTPPTTDPGTATGSDPSTVPASGAGCWASHHHTVATVPATDRAA